MQTGIGLSRLLILAGAGKQLFFFIHHLWSLWRRFDSTLVLTYWWFWGSEGYTGTILVKNGKMSDLLGELQVSSKLSSFFWVLNSKGNCKIKKNGSFFAFCLKGFGEEIWEIRRSFRWRFWSHVYWGKCCCCCVSYLTLSELVSNYVCVCVWVV